MFDSSKASVSLASLKGNKTRVDNVSIEKSENDGYVFRVSIRTQTKNGSNYETKIYVAQDTSEVVDRLAEIFADKKKRSKPLPSSY